MLKQFECVYHEKNLRVLIKVDCKILYAWAEFRYEQIFSYGLKLHYGFVNTPEACEDWANRMFQTDNGKLRRIAIIEDMLSLQHELRTDRRFACYPFYDIWRKRFGSNDIPIPIQNRSETFLSNMLQSDDPSERNEPPDPERDSSTWRRI